VGVVRHENILGRRSSQGRCTPSNLEQLVTALLLEIIYGGPQGIIEGHYIVLLLLTLRFDASRKLLHVFIASVSLDFLGFLRLAVVLGLFVGSDLLPLLTALL
jgi:hypothetical protein